jgi:hypothetical protein
VQCIGDYTMYDTRTSVILLDYTLNLSVFLLEYDQNITDLLCTSLSESIQIVIMLLIVFVDSKNHVLMYCYTINFCK